MGMLRAAVSGFVLLVVAPLLLAQDPSKDEVDRQVQEMRRQVTLGQVVRSHVRVTVRLNNGNRIKGIVKDGFLVERVDGLRFVAAEKDEPGAGIRVYYYNGTNNYVFLPFAQVREYCVNERLTSADLELIEARLRRQQEEEAQQQQQQQADAPQGDAGQPAAPDGKTPDAKTGDGKDGTAKAGVPPADGGLTQEQRDLFELFKAYPPQAGWSQARRDEISRRLAVIGANPSPEEKKFVEHFAEWQRACAIFGVKDEPPAQPAEEEEQGHHRRRH